MPPGELDRLLRNYATRLDAITRRVDRLETLEFTSGAGLLCLATTQITGDTASVTFSNISQNFLHLWLWILSKTPGVAGGCTNRMTFNGDTGTNYKFHNKYDIRTGVVDTEAVSGGTGTTSDLVLGGLSGDPDWAACEVNILNYALLGSYATRRPVIWKAWRQDSPGGEIAPFVSLEQGGGEWLNTTSPITSITITAGGGTCRYAAGSLITLMGVCPN